MKNSYRGLLKRIYDANTVQALEVIQSIKRVHNDHRDFYPLIALVNSSHIGYTGPVPEPGVPYRDILIAHSLQAYCQGPGEQSYKSAQVLGGAEGVDNYFYIGPKGIEYFETRRADNKKLFMSAFFSLLAGTTVALISYCLKLSAQ